MKKQKVKEPNTSQEERKGFKDTVKFIWNNFKSVFITIFVVFIIFQFVLLNGIIPSSSMETTVMKGDSIIAFRMAYMFLQPERGDIIIFNSEQTNHTEYIKRVIGVGGDIVELKDGEVYVNDKKLEENYIQGKTYVGDNNISKFKVPEGCVLVFGDNRENSADSRFMNNPYIKCEDITGKLILRYSIFGNGFFFKLI